MGQTGAALLSVMKCLSGENVMTIRMILLFILAFIWTPSMVFSEVATKHISYEFNGVTFEGYLAWNDAIKGERPGVLVVHEWWGLNDFARQQAEKLAKMGYNAFALDMYGKGKVTDHPETASEWSRQVTGSIDTWQQRANAGLAVLRKDKNTDKERIAAIGYCFGGSTVQQMAYSGADIKGVVSFHGSLVNPPEDQNGSVHAKMLICHGGADPMIEKESIPGYVSAMEKSGIDWQMVVYGGARHSFTNPGADAVGMEAIAYSESADRRSWQHMKLFLDELF